MNMWFKTLFVGLVTFTLICNRSYANAQLPPNPCPNVFTYANSGNKVVGIITVKNLEYGQINTEIQLSQSGNLHSINAGQLSLNTNKDNVLDYINSGKPIIYRVDFPSPNVIPRVTSINVNGQQICSGPEVQSSNKASMKLQHTFSGSQSGSPQHHFGSDSNFDTPFQQHLNFMGSFNEPHTQNVHQSSFNQDLFNPDSFNRNSINEDSSGRNLFGQDSFNHAPFYQNSMNSASNNEHTMHQLPEHHRQALERMRLMQQQQINQPSINPFGLTSPRRDPFFPNPFHNNANNLHAFQNRFFQNHMDSLASNIRPINNYPQSPTQVNPQSPIRNNANASPQIKTTTPRPLTTSYPRPTPIRVAPTKPIQTTTQPPKTRITNEYINSVCGYENTDVDIRRLNINGQVIAKSRFPWIVAIFKKSNKDILFQCGGNLISTRTIVSAAHCFYEGTVILRPEEILASMGRHNLTDWTEGKFMDVEKVIGHPQYDSQSFNSDADLAILRLKGNVIFTMAIRPVCMWQGSTDPSIIAGVSGIIVGWGADEHSNSTTVPTLVNTTIVSEIQCLRSNEQFFSITSNRTICAGNPNKNSGPCTGDSGNGLMIRKNNKWMLRGTVSASTGTPDRPCNVEEYAIYADIAMFIDWIRANMVL